CVRAKRLSSGTSREHAGQRSKPSGLPKGARGERHYPTRSGAGLALYPFTPVVSARRRSSPAASSLVLINRRLPDPAGGSLFLPPLGPQVHQRRSIPVPGVGRQGSRFFLRPCRNDLVHCERLPNCDRTRRLDGTNHIPIYISSPDR